MSAHFLTEIILIITAAFIGGFTARSLRFPPILGYIISGVIFGAIGRNFFESYQTLLNFSSIGVSLLLFSLGFEISLDSLKKIDKKVLLVGIVQLLLVALMLFPILMVFNFSVQVASLLALLFSFSSTVVVVKILEEQGKLHDFPGNHVFIFLLIQDLFVVPVLFLIPLLFAKHGISIENLGTFFVASIKPLLIFLGILIFSRFFLSRFLNILYRYPSHELTILATIFIAAVSIGLLQYVGLPQSIAAFLAGILISEEGKNLAPLSEIRPFRDILLVVFFVLTGMLLDPLYITSHIVFIVSLTLVVLLVKFVGTYFTLRNSGYLGIPSSFIAAHMTNIGEFAVVIGQIALMEKVISQEIYFSVLSVFILSFIIAPFLMKYELHIGRGLSKFGLMQKLFGSSYDTFENASTEKLNNHVVICGHGKVGKEVRHLLDYAQIPYIVIDFNKQIISQLIQQSKIALYGDPTDEDVLKSAGIENARAVVITVSDSMSQKKIIKTTLSLNPNAIIICRSHIEHDKIDLANLGVNAIVMPEFEAGIRIGREVLNVFGVKEDNLSVLIKKLRREHFLQ